MRGLRTVVRAKERMMRTKNNMYTFVLVALLTLSAYLLADTVDAVIGRSLEAAPQPGSAFDRAAAETAPRRDLSDYGSILERGMFGEGRGSSVSAAAATTAFRLIGTITGDVFSGAVLEDPQGVQTFYRLQEKLADGFQLVKVLRERVLLRNPAGGTVELQVVDDAKIVNVSKPAAAPFRGGVRAVGDGRFMVDQQAVQQSTENLSQLLTQARAVPFVENGRTVGFRISEIVPGSLYERIGLTNGDVIQKINSTDVDDPGKFFQMYQGLKDERSISIDLLRNGQRQTLTYEIR